MSGWISIERHEAAVRQLRERLAEAEERAKVAEERFAEEKFYYRGSHVVALADTDTEESV